MRNPASSFFSVKRGGPYGRYGRSHALYTSEDLERWTKVPIAGEDSLFHADDEDQEHNREAIKALMEELVADPRLAETDFYAEGNYNVDVYNTPVFRYESHYLALPAIHPSITMDLSDPSDNIAFKIPQLWWSRDLENWGRPKDREEFITLSRTESGAYDLAVAFPPSSPVIRGDELWFYYAGEDGLEVLSAGQVSDLPGSAAPGRIHVTRRRGGRVGAHEGIHRARPRAVRQRRCNGWPARRRSDRRECSSGTICATTGGPARRRGSVAGWEHSRP